MNLEIRVDYASFSEVYIESFECAHAGADPGFFIRKSNAEGGRHATGVRGHAPTENFEI